MNHWYKAKGFMVFLSLLVVVGFGQCLETRYGIINGRQYEYDEPPSQIVHENLGVIFRGKEKIISENDMWLHTFRVPLMDFDNAYETIRKYNSTICSADVRTDVVGYYDNCLFYGDILSSSHKFSRHLVMKYKQNMESIHNMGIKPKSSGKRSIFGIDAISWLFPVASKKDLKTTFKRLKVLQSQTLNITNSFGKLEGDFLSYIKINDRRFSNIVDSVESHDRMLLNMSSDLHELATLRRYDNRKYKRQFMQNSKFNSVALTQVAFVNEILIDLHQTSSEVKLGLESLLQGKLSRFLIPESDMQHAVSQIVSALESKHPDIRLLYYTTSDIFSHATAIGHIDKDNVLHVIVHLPMKSDLMGYDLYHAQVLPLPVVQSTNNSDIVLGNTVFDVEDKYIAVNYYVSKYMTLSIDEMQDCIYDASLYICTHLSVIRQMADQPTCISSLFEGDMVRVKDNCMSKFHRTDKAVEFATSLGPSEFLVTSQPEKQWTLKCKEISIPQMSCPHCVIQLKCDCKLVTDSWTIQSSVALCENTATLINVSHAFNFPMYMHYFTEQELLNITSRDTFVSKFQFKPSFSLPAMTEHHDISEVDTKFSHETSKLAKNLQHGVITYNSLAEKLLNLDSLDQNEGNDGAIFSSHWVTTGSLFALVFLQWVVIAWLIYRVSVLNNKISEIIMGGLAVTQKLINGAEAWSIDQTSMNNDQNTRALPQKKNAGPHLFDIIVLAIVSVLIAKLIFAFLARLFNFLKQNYPSKVLVGNIKTTIYLELFDNYSSAMIRVADTPLHENMLAITRLDNRISMSVEKTFLGGILHINWNSYTIDIEGTFNMVPLCDSIRINFIQANKLKHLISNHVKANIILSENGMINRHCIRVIGAPVLNSGPRLRTISV